MENFAFVKTGKPYHNPVDGCANLPWMCNQSEPCTKSTLTKLNYIVTQCTMQFFDR